MSTVAVRSCWLVATPPATWKVLTKALQYSPRPETEGRSAQLEDSIGDCADCALTYVLVALFGTRREHSYDIGMKLAPDLEAASWLDGLAGEPKDFEWDAGNRAKNRKHEVEPEDVEAMFRRPRFVVFAGRIVAPAYDEPRWLVLGQDGRERRLALVLTRRAIACDRSVAGR